MSVLGIRLRIARKNKRLTQEDVAKSLNITYQTISNYERGTRDPDTETLDKLANIFGTTTDYLLGRSDDQFQPQSKQNVFPLRNLESINLTPEELEFLETIRGLKKHERQMMKNIAKTLIGDDEQAAASE